MENALRSMPAWRRKAPLQNPRRFLSVGRVSGPVFAIGAAGMEGAVEEATVCIDRARSVGGTNVAASCFVAAEWGGSAGTCGKGPEGGGVRGGVRDGSTGIGTETEGGDWSSCITCGLSDCARMGRRGMSRSYLFATFSESDLGSRRGGLLFSCRYRTCSRWPWLEACALEE